MSDILKTAACYIRVSTDKQEELSPASQLKEIKNYARQNGYFLSAEYIFQEEEGVSGRKADKRPEFQRMIATAKQKPQPFDAIIVWKFSRFARNQDEASFYKGMLRKKLNIDVVSVSEPISEGMYGRLIEMIIEWSDEFYSYNLSGEVMRGMKEKATRGGYQSQFPYGYRMIDSKPQVYDEEACVVKRIFNDFVVDHKALIDITKTLNALGIKTRKGNTWEYRTVKYIIENPFYIGKIRWNRQHHETHTIKDTSEWIISDAEHEAIIPEDIYNQAQYIISQRKLSNRRAASSTKHWLSGIVKCSNCGYSLFVGGRTANGHIFQCGNYQKGKCAKSHGIMEKRLTAEIINSLREIVKSGNADYEVLRLPETSNDIDILKLQLEKITLKEQRIKAAYRDGIDTLEEYKENKRILQNERGAVEKDLLNLQTRESSEHNMSSYINSLKNVIDIIEYSEDNQKKRDALCSIVKQITYYKEENFIELELVSYE